LSDLPISVDSVRLHGVLVPTSEYRYTVEDTHDFLLGWKITVYFGEGISLYNFSYYVGTDYSFTRRGALKKAQAMAAKHHKKRTDPEPPVETGIISFK
jgi:hypothetical protein